MQDFEKLSEEEQQEVILSIGNKLTDKERWYWMGLIHLLRTLKERNDKAIEYIEKSKLNQIDTHCKYLYTDWDGNIHNLDELLEILKGSDKE